MNIRQCPNCPSQTPIVSDALARQIVARLDPAAHRELVDVCGAWLSRKDSGLVVYEGIRGRAYTALEKAAIATDQNIVASLPCPFEVEGIGCGLGGYCTAHEWLGEPQRAPYSFLPTIMLKLLDVRALAHLIDTRHVADAKIAAATVRNDFPILDPNGPVLVGARTAAHEATLKQREVESHGIYIP